ncbi:AAA-like domain-containing protein [Nostoc sp. DedSLP04]|uniref:AAA-like domain-containing protein n=1 Tax=Nostoc sp. DedSLP04 TaxID=3075401 RepID=UPI002AD58669|nr:AAA-like domain-containing protein [Nostoc sp. DedSLP04]MDZ8034956.1 AAA-like domain-containing protein [Nostoc sp. DedSLP04]
MFEQNTYNDGTITKAMDYRKFEQIWKELERKPKQKNAALQMLKGLPDAEIANNLDMKEATVRKHIEKTYKAFGLNNRRELVSLCAQYKRELVIGNNTINQTKHMMQPLTGRVPLDSPLYLERSADEKCRQYLQAAQNREESLPFIRIRASKGMGKSSLLVRLCQFLERQQKQAVGFIDLGSIDLSEFADLNQLLYQFTFVIAQKFSNKLNNHTPPDLKDYWRKDIASGLNCTNYLKEHIFSKIEQPKTLFIDGIDAVLGQEKTQNPFLNLLRTWNESEMKLVSEVPIVWPSIVIAYSTEPYPEYGIKGSIMQNVGIEIDLKEFSPDETLELAKRYGLNWSLNEVNLLRQLIGGHPALINRAFFEISQGHITLAELEMKATSPTSPFRDDLLKKLDLLEANENLKQCFNKILSGERCTDEFANFQLEKAGLIKVGQDEVKVACELYRKYFDLHL